MKKFVSILLCLIFMTSMCVCSNVNVSAKSYITSSGSANGSDYTNITKLANKLNQVFKGDIGLYSNSACTNSVSAPLGSRKMTGSNQYWIKSNTTGSKNSGWQCYIYADAVYNTLFNEWVGKGTSLSHSHKVMSGGKNTVSYSDFKNAGVRTGAIMRTTANSNGSWNSSKAHSLIILSYNSSGIKYVEGNGDGKGLVRIANLSWSEFNSGQLKGRSRYVCFIIQPTDGYYDDLYPNNNAKVSFDKSSISLGLSSNNTATVTATISGNYAHWESSWNGKYINAERSINGNTFTFKISSRTAGSSILSLKCQDENYNTLSEASVNINITYDRKDDFSFSYDPNGGSGDTLPFKVKYGDDFTVLNNTCYKKGYHFSGWNVKRVYDNTWYVAGVGWCSETTIKNNNYTKKVYSNRQGVTLDPTWTNGLSSASSYVFYATWSENNMSVSYNGNGGTGKMESTSFDFTWDYEIPSCTFVRPGYSFAGWNIYRVNDGTWATVGYGWLTESELANQNVNKQVFSYGESYRIDDSWSNGCSDDYYEYEAYAIWEKKSFDFSFDSNGGMGDSNSFILKFDDDLILPKCPFTKNGYTFDCWNVYRVNDGTWATEGYGWLTSSQLESQGIDKQIFEVDDSYVIDDSWVNGCTDENVKFVLYAYWTPNTYTVSYNVNGGTGSIASQTKTHDTNLTLTATKPTGKSFTVTYNANGGTVSSSSKTVSQSFTNWNTAANGSGTAYNAGATYSANASITLYAQYANPSIGSLPTPTRPGYAFDGWYTAATGGTKITDLTKVTANTTVYAHWKANAYTVSYNMNGGTGSIASQTKTHGTNLTLTTTKPTGKNFTVTYNANGGTVSSSSKTVSQSFTNWNTAANGSGTAYNAGATYSTNANVTLYAQYANPSIGSLPTPTRSGYAFDGWYTAANGGTKITDSTKVTANTTVYAHWKANAYTVSYNVNGGTGSIASQTKTHDTNLTLTTTKPTGKSFTVTYNANGGKVSSSSKTVSQSFMNWNTAANGSGTAYNAGATYSTNASVTLYAQYANPSIGLLPTPTRSGYAFDGWYTAANGGTKITDSTKVTANTTVYAHWTKNAETKAVVKDVKIEHNATVNYKSTYMLSPEITADKGAKYTVKYSSSNTKVATVDENGKIYGAKKGNATITCTVTDSYGNVVTDKCNVNVDYSGAQWFIIIVLFGWIWYI